MTKVNITAIKPFSHGNVDAKEGGTYAMNKGDAQELEKAGFVIMGGENPEQTQADQPRQAKQVGDVVVDDPEDLLGDGKAAAPLDNKMAEAPRNKSTAKK